MNNNLEPYIIHKKIRKCNNRIILYYVKSENPLTFLPSFNILISFYICRLVQHAMFL
jgi:hypothetical protein